MTTPSIPVALRRQCHGFVNVPSDAKSLLNHVPLYTCDATPFGQRACFATPFDQSITAPVVGLFSPCRPSDIARFVVAVIVNAINRMLQRWPLTDVRAEVNERFSPTVAHANPTRAVPLDNWNQQDDDTCESSYTTLGATEFQLCPCLVFRRISPSRNMQPQDSVPRRRHTTQIAVRHNRSTAAIADALPVRLRVSDTIVGDNRQASVAVSDEVNDAVRSRAHTHYLTIRRR